MYGTPRLRRLAPLLALIAVAFILPVFLPAYFLFLANLLLMYAILALGLDILVGWAGQFAFAHIAFFGIGAYTTVLVQLRLGLPFFAGIVIGALLATAVGVLVALPATRLRTVYLALATIAFSESVRWVCNSWTAVTNGADGLRIGAPSLFGYVLGDDARALPVVAVIAAIMIGGAQYLTCSKFGRALCAIRESEHLAAASGINAQRTKTLAFAISALYAAVAGGVYTLFQSFVNAEMFGFQQLIFVLSMIIVGGLGSIPGVLIGVVVIGLLPDIMRSTMSNVLVWQEMVYGLILLLCMMFMPSGIWGLIGRRFAGHERP